MASGDQQVSAWTGAFPGDASMERRQCTKCETNSPNCYWQHAGDSKKSFLHFFKGNEAPRLALNANFFGSFGGMISDAVRIYMRSGDFYYVKANRRGSLCILDNGWDMIRKDHGIVAGDYGVFTYCGPSEIRLRLFDSTGVEKYSSFVICSGNQQALGRVDEVGPLERHKKVYAGLLIRINAVGHGTLPSYVCFMSIGNIDRGYLNFSKEYTSRCDLKKNDRSIFLANSDWSIVMLAHVSIYRDGIARITSGWKAFARCNGIKPGYLVMFKMDRGGKQQRLRSTVHVFKQE